MLTDAGFENLTPQSLADAIEEERDVPLTAADEARTLIKNKLVVLLVTNTQVQDASFGGPSENGRIGGDSSCGAQRSNSE